MKILIPNKNLLNKNSFVSFIKDKKFYIALFVLLVFISSTYVYKSKADVTNFVQTSSRIAEINKINAPDIMAKNATVYDVTNKDFVYSKGGDKSVPMASLVKIITTATFFELNYQKEKTGNKIDIIKIIKKNKGYNQGDRDLVNNEYWKVDNLIRYILMTSSNVGAESLANSITDDEFAFALLMNKKVKDLGFKSFSFKNVSGLSIPNPDYDAHSSTSPKEIPSAYGSAKEIAVLFNTIFTSIPFLGSATIIPEATFVNWSRNVHQTKNVNFSLTQIPNIIAGKTGTTDDAGGNVMIIMEINKNKYVIVVMGSTIEDRYNDLDKLASSTESFATLK